MIAIPRVVVVDNNEDELDQLHQALIYSGIPSIPILYDAASWPPKVLPDCSSVRLVFLDLNLLDGTPADAKSITPHVARVLSKLLTRGPYILAFWSKHREVSDDVVTMLRDRHRDEVIPPLRYLVVNKLEFQLSEKEKQDPKSVAALGERVNQIIGETPLLDALTRWEDRISRGAASTVSRLYELAAAQDKWNSDDVEKRLARLMTWIGHEAIGRKTAGEMPSEAAEQGLVHALADDLSRTPGDRPYEAVWKAAMPEIGSKGFVPGADLPSASLNEVFHVDTRGVTKKDRGAFVVLTDQVIADEGQFAAIFGKTVKELRTDFINLATVAKADRNATLEKCQLGLVELSAACDHAQHKSRSLRYVLAALIPLELADNTRFGDADERGRLPRTSSHDAIYRLPPIRVKRSSYICKLNFRHILGLPETSPILGEALFRIRVPLLDEIAYKCSMHLARPGVMSFHDHGAGD